MIRASVVRGTGFTGAELLRLLLTHPDVELLEVSSRQEADRKLSEILPHLVELRGLRFTPTITDHRWNIIGLVPLSLPLPTVTKNSLFGEPCCLLNGNLASILSVPRVV